jgi:ribonuclease VapC
MFLDASATVAILNREADSGALLERLRSSPTPLCFSPLSRFEAVTALARGRAGRHRSPSKDDIVEFGDIVDAFFHEIGARNLDLTAAIGLAAQDAAQTWGRCVGHPAGLNLGDCFAYACAKAAGVGLLYKGEDFALTDMG